VPHRADAYFELALLVIPLSKSRLDLRDWWAAEQGRRDQYDLSQQQIDDLADACREHIHSLGEVPTEKPRRSTPSRRRSAI
jgi:hypothetical protein